MTPSIFRPRPGFRLLLLLAALQTAQLVSASAKPSDPVLEWIAITNDTALSTATNPVVTTRVLSLVSASVFDAVNGIERRYRPLHVRPNAPRDASAKAASVQAAYAILINFYPTLMPSLTAERNSSISALSQHEPPKAIQAGVSWGQTVADKIWLKRLEDGFAPPPPPFLGVLGLAGSPAAVGFWRPTPLLNLPGAAPQAATMRPWVLRRPSQFRLPPPYALTSPEYAADYNETKIMGAYNGSPRTADQSELALFWAGNTPLYWDRIASQVSASQSLTFSENARLFSLLNVSMTDALIADWDTKYRYVFWRPITAIREGDADGNTVTDPDPAWTPWLDFFPPGTPNHPEYPSAHASLSGAAATILASVFGDDTAFTVTSNVRPGSRTFPSFSAAVAEIANARVFGGIHFRTSCIIGNTLGKEVALYVLSHSMRAEDADRDAHKGALE